MNYTRLAEIYDPRTGFPSHSNLVEGKDSNLRRLSRQIYSLFPLTAWVPLQKGRQILPRKGGRVNAQHAFLRRK